MSKATAMFVDARITGDPKSGRPHLQYTPGYLKPDGTSIKPRLVFSIMVNNGKEGTPPAHKIVTWVNSPTLVWDLALGRSVTLTDLQIESYWTRAFFNNQVLMNPDNTEVQVKRVQYKLMNLNDLHIGRHSKKFEEAEAQLALQEINAGTRRPDWNTPGTEGWRIHRILNYIKRHRPYTGGQTFGYAEVMPIPNGCALQLTVYNEAELRKQAEASVDKTINSMHSGQNAVTAGLQTVGATIASSAGVMPAPPPQEVVKVEGFTMDEYMRVGWTLPRMQMEPKFAAFFKTAPAPAQTQTVAAVQNAFTSIQNGTTKF